MTAAATDENETESAGLLVSEENWDLRQAAMGEDHRATYSRGLHARSDENCQAQNRAHRCGPRARLFVPESQAQARIDDGSLLGAATSPATPDIQKLVDTAD